MKVHVQLMGYLAKYSPTQKETFQLEMEPGATLGRLLEKIGFPPDLEKMVLVNGHRSDEATRLAEEDEVFIFSPAAGG